MGVFSQSNIEFNLHFNGRLLKTSILSIHFFSTVASAEKAGLNISKNFFNRLVPDNINATIPSYSGIHSHCGFFVII